MGFLSSMSNEPGSHACDAKLVLYGMDIWRLLRGTFVRGGIVMSRVRGILLHVCMVCSLVCMTAKILDWYNPYMDFTGHIWGIQMALYLSVIVLGITRKKPPNKKAKIYRVPT